MRTVRAERIAFDSSRQVREDDFALVVPAILTRESILPFSDGFGYRPAKELFDAAWTLEGAWVVAYSHIASVFVTNRADIRGRVANAKFDENFNGVVGDIQFIKAMCDAQLLKGVRSGSLKDVSVAYYAEDDFTPGRFGDEVYDFVQRNFMFGHVAAGVPEGRCPSPYCGMNADSLLCRCRMDPEETDDFVHIRIRSPDLFVESSFRTLVIDAAEGVKAVVGKLKASPKGSTVVQKFIFAKARGWTMDKANAWIQSRKDSEFTTSIQEPCDPRSKVLDPAEVLAASRRLLSDSNMSSTGDRPSCYDWARDGALATTTGRYK